MIDPNKPGQKTTEFYGQPVATGLIASGVTVLTTMGGSLGPSMAVGAGLGLVAAGALIQITYNLGRVSLKKTVAEAGQVDLEELAKQVLPAVVSALPAAAAVVAAAQPTEKKEEVKAP